jgi:hypothetical protein
MPPRHPSDDRTFVPIPPQPSASSAPDGVAATRELARCYLPNALRLFASIAFSCDAEASLHTRLHAAREVVALAGVLPPTTPDLPPPSHEAASGRADN